MGPLVLCVRGWCPHTNTAIRISFKRKPSLCSFSNKSPNSSSSSLGLQSLLVRRLRCCCWRLCYTVTHFRRLSSLLIVFSVAFAFLLLLQVFQFWRSQVENLQFGPLAKLASFQRECHLWLSSLRRGERTGSSVVFLVLFWDFCREKFCGGFGRSIWRVFWLSAGLIRLFQDWGERLVRFREQIFFLFSSPRDWELRTRSWCWLRRRWDPRRRHGLLILRAAFWIELPEGVVIITSD